MSDGTGLPRYGDVTLVEWFPESSRSRWAHLARDSTGRDLNTAPEQMLLKPDNPAELVLDLVGDGIDIGVIDPVPFVGGLIQQELSDGFAAGIPDLQEAPTHLAWPPG